MITNNKHRAKSSSILRKTNQLLDLNLRYKASSARKKKSRKKKFKVARSQSQPGIISKNPNTIKKDKKYQPCMKQNQIFFEKAKNVYSDKIFSLKSKIASKDKNLKKLKMELKDNKISKKSFEEVCHINSVLIMKMRRLQHGNKTLEDEFQILRNQLKKIFKILQKVQIKFMDEIKNFEEEKDKEIEILKNLNDINLNQMSDKFDSLIKIIQDVKLELEQTEKSEELDFFREMNDKLINKIHETGLNELEKNKAKIDLWRARDDYIELKNTLRKVESEFERREIEYKNQILELKNRIKVKSIEEKKTMKIRVGKEIQSNLHQGNLLKNKIKNLSFSKDKFMNGGSKTVRCGAFDRSGRVDTKKGYIKGNYFGRTKKRKKKVCSKVRGFGSLGVNSLGAKEADAIAESLLKGV